MSPAHWLWLGFASLTLLLGLAATRRALSTRQAAYRDYLLEHRAEALYRCPRCGFLVASDQHLDPYKGRRCS